MQRVFTRQVDSTKLQCLVPPKHSQDPSEVRVSVGSVHHPYLAIGSAMFRYAENCFISSISPNIGPEGGGMLVNLLGVGLLQDSNPGPQIQFGVGAPVPGVVTVPHSGIGVNSPTVVQSVVPARLAGSTSISVSFNGGADFCQSSGYSNINSSKQNCINPLKI